MVAVYRMQYYVIYVVKMIDLYSIILIEWYDVQLGIDIICTFF